MSAQLKFWKTSIVSVELSVLRFPEPYWTLICYWVKFFFSIVGLARQLSCNCTVKLQLYKTYHGWSHIKLDNSLESRQTCLNSKHVLSTFEAIIHNVIWFPRQDEVKSIYINDIVRCQIQNCFFQQVDN